MRKTEKPASAAAPAPRSVEELTEALAAPFDPHEVRFKPAVVNGHRAMAMAYIDARVIQDRLDEVLGGAGWQDEYECLPDGSVVCRLRLRLGSEWITKMDVGGPSEQPDEGDRRKAAFSDALKRAAVKFGIGRYLYRLPAQWVDYDPQKRTFVRPPRRTARRSRRRRCRPTAQSCNGGCTTTTRCWRSRDCASPASWSSMWCRPASRRATRATSRTGAATPSCSPSRRRKASRTGCGRRAGTGKRSRKSQRDSRRRVGDVSSACRFSLPVPRRWQE